MGVPGHAVAGMGQHDRRERSFAARPVEPARQLGPGRDNADRDRQEVHGLGPRDAGDEDEQQDREDAAHGSY